MSAVPPLWGLVLAGGHSRRYGEDKAGLIVGGRPMLARMVSIVEPLVQSCRVGVRADQTMDALRKSYSLLTDSWPDQGPAGALAAAQALQPDAAWLVVACDMPALDAQCLAELCAQRCPEQAATAYRSPVDGQPEPLCAIYEPATLARFRQQLAEGGNRSPRQLLSTADACLIDILRPDCLANINTPGELERLRAKGVLDD